MQDVAQALPRVARRVTLYASSTDKALQASKSFHQYERIGDAGSGLAVCQGSIPSTLRTWTPTCWATATW